MGVLSHVANPFAIGDVNHNQANGSLDRNGHLRHRVATCHAQHPQQQGSPPPSPSASTETVRDPRERKRRAPILVAISRCKTGEIMRSSSVTAYHEGLIATRRLSLDREVRWHEWVAARQQRPRPRLSASRARGTPAQQPAAGTKIRQRLLRFGSERVRAIQYRERGRPSRGRQASRRRGRDNFRDNRAKSTIRVESLKSASPVRQ